MKIAVVGGGIFGITTALKLAELGHGIDLFEMNGQLLSCASMVNQFRMHRGYHYPRSKETAISAKEGFESFRQFYKQCLLQDFNHYYCIAKEKSLTSPDRFISFCKELGLEYEITEPPEVVKRESISLCVRVKECMLSPSKLLDFCNQSLKKNKVNIYFRKFRPSDTNRYDIVINATYANQNYLLQESYPDKMTDYQFEVVEKLVLKLPVQFKNLSIVIIDGPFTCVDPFDTTGYHLMGNVEVAILSRNIGRYPNIPPNVKPMLNKGIVPNPMITRFNDFVLAAEEFFYEVEKAEHIGSMFTVRTVLPHHEHDDARPTEVEKIGDRLVSVFSGKIPTCVSAADRIIDLISAKDST